QRNDDFNEGSIATSVKRIVLPKHPSSKTNQLAEDHKTGSCDGCSRDKLTQKRVMDPGEATTELPQLNQVEEMLIAQTNSGFQTNGTNKKYSKLIKRQYMLSKVAKYLVEHQIELPICLLAVITLAYILKVPGSEKFLFLHENPKTGLYETSMDDAYFVFFWIVTFTLLRAATMEYILTPIAKKGRIKKNARITRFAEQGWSFLYYSVFWTFGMYLMYHSPYWFDTTYFWKDYPHKELTYSFKAYYLLQFAFWLQQLFVLNVEKRRKDFVEMATHHVITILLMFFSYIFNLTRIGNAVLCTMDFADIQLP
ncbi:36904_t:CDS:2, partial [Gigaspora margarita]